jgi:hypothetical protein
MSENAAFERLYPVVAVFAILFDVTESSFVAALRPVNDV